MGIFHKVKDVWALYTMPSLEGSGRGRECRQRSLDEVVNKLLTAICGEQPADGFVTTLTEKFGLNGTDVPRLLILKAVMSSEDKEKAKEKLTKVMTWIPDTPNVPSSDLLTIIHEIGYDPLMKRALEVLIELRTLADVLGAIKDDAAVRDRWLTRILACGAAGATVEDRVKKIFGIIDTNNWGDFFGQFVGFLHDVKTKQPKSSPNGSSKPQANIPPSG